MASINAKGGPMLYASFKLDIQRRKTAAIYAWINHYAPVLISVWNSLTERLAEWLLAAITIGWGWVLLQPGDTFQGLTFAAMKSWMSEEQWTVFFLLGGSARIAMLTINGHWRKSPHLRMLAAASSFWVWVFLAIGFALAGNNSPGALIYSLFGFSELVNVFRASRDAGFNDEKAALSKGIG